MRGQSLLDRPRIKDHEARVTTACLLAAGTGSRLSPLTDSIPKCLTEINGRPILERLVACLRQQGIKRLVIVVGYLEPRIREFMDAHASDLVVEYVRNTIYLTTNNIYSLWLAGSKIQESFLLVESDLIFDAHQLEGLLTPDRIAVSRLLPWMNGTTIKMDSSGHLDSFNRAPAAEGTSGICEVQTTPSSLRDYEYKTVNICSLSSATWSRILPRLERAIADGRVNVYYEEVFAEMVADGSLSFDCVLFDADRWYEVDRLEDVARAERVARRMTPKRSKPLLPALISAAGVHTP
jgi:choline kinase